MSHAEIVKRFRNHLKIDIPEKNQNQDSKLLRKLLERSAYRYQIPDQNFAKTILKRYCEQHVCDNQRCGILSKTDIPDQYDLYIYSSQNNDDQMVKLEVTISGEACVILGEERLLQGLVLLTDVGGFFNNFDFFPVDFPGSISAKIMMPSRRVYFTKEVDSQPDDELSPGAVFAIS